MIKLKLRACLIAALSLVAAGRETQAQCNGAWQSGLGPPGTDGTINAQTVWDADGAGPLAPVLVVAGSFTVASNVPALGVAVYDPASNRWSALGSGIEGSISTLLSTPDGRLFAAGGFANPGGTPVLRVAQWTGAQWQDVGGTTPNGGFRSSFAALAILSNGDLIVAGNFDNVSGVTAVDVARWNGVTWQALGTGIGGTTGVPNVTTVLPLSSTELIVAGAFTQAGGNPANNIARWNGTTWVPLGTGLNSGAFALARLANGDIVAGGQFTSAGGTPSNRIARWNGTAWSALGQGVGGTVNDLLVLPTGELLTTGSFSTAGGATARSVARWNGTAWSTLGAGLTAFNLATVNKVALGPAGQLFFAGAFENAGGDPARNAARWDGTAWRALGEGIVGNVRAIAPRGASELFVGGDFTLVTDQAVIRNLAHWTGTQWRSVGPSLPNFSVRALAVTPSGELLLGASGLTTISGVTVNNVARWNGNAWSGLGAGLINGQVNTLAALANGRVIAGGTFNTSGTTSVNRLAHWNGAAWSAVGGGVGPGSVGAVLAVTDDEYLVAANF